MTDPRLEAARAAFASLAAAQSGAPADLRERIDRAFVSTPREMFMGPPPWTIHTGGAFAPVTTSDPILLCQNVLVSLDRERGVNNGEPFLHAQLIAALHPKRGDRALHIGCGTGYYTAILATLIAPEGSIIGYEILPALAAQARTNLNAWSNAHVVEASGADAALPESDLIYVSAGASRPANVWLDALSDGGKLVFPLVGAGGSGAAIRIERRGARFEAMFTGRVGFITCAGAYDADEAKRVGEGLTRAQRKQRFELIRDDKDSADTIVRGKGWRLVAI